MTNSKTDVALKMGLGVLVITILALSTFLVTAYINGQDTTQNSEKNIQMLTEQEASFIAAGITQGTVKEIEAANINSRVVYEVETVKENSQYEVKIDVLTGEVIDIEVESIEEEEDDGTKEDKNQPLQLTSKGITQHDAEQIALERFPSGSIGDVELEVEQGKQVYEVEIRDSGEEYDVLIDTKTGNIIGVEKE